LWRVEQARAQSENLANSCKKSAETIPHPGHGDASPTPGKSLPS
jgi:hypothetical protein